MSDKNPMTKEYFARRLAELCLKSGLAGFPRDEADRHILLKSAMLVIGQTGAMTEGEVNEKLGLWVLQVGQMLSLDRVTVRRTLVDTGYLIRTKDGSSYHVANPGPRPDLFAPEVDQLDIPAVIQAGREEIERRKREYLEKAKKG